jgi:hypothetical protein
MASLRSRVLACSVLSRADQDKGACEELRQSQRYELPVAPQLQVCLALHKNESREVAPVPSGTRQYQKVRVRLTPIWQDLAAECLIIMILATSTFRRWQFVISSPGKQPGFHVFVFHVVARFYLAIRLTNLRPDAFLVINIGLYCIGDEKISAPARFFGQFCQLLLGFCLQSDT